MEQAHKRQRSRYGIVIKYRTAIISTVDLVKNRAKLQTLDGTCQSILRMGEDEGRRACAIGLSLTVGSPSKYFDLCISIAMQDKMTCEKSRAPA